MDSVFVNAFIDELEKLGGKWVSAKTKLKYGVPAAGLGAIGLTAFSLGKGIKEGEQAALMEARSRGRY